MSETKQDEQLISERLGEWEVPTTTHEPFGEVLKHGLGGPVIFMSRPQHGGWRAFGFLHMSHQTYQKKVEKHLEDHGGTTEVVVVDVDAGKRKTVWSRNNHDPIYTLEEGRYTDDSSEPEAARYRNPPEYHGIEEPPREDGGEGQ